MPFIGQHITELIERFDLVSLNFPSIFLVLFKVNLCRSVMVQSMIAKKSAALMIGV
jgi:hypothetical protein